MGICFKHCIPVRPDNLFVLKNNKRPQLTAAVYYYSGCFFYVKDNNMWIVKYADVKPRLQWIG